MMVSPLKRLAVVLMSVSAMCTIVDAILSSRVYSQLYGGGVKINGSYAFFYSISSLCCAMRCTATPGCWVYTWDHPSNECGLLNGPSTPILTVGALPSLRTYYASRVDGKTFRLTNGTGKWNSVKAECENMGGRLYFPEDTGYMLVLHHVLGVNQTWIGMRRNPTDSINTWYDMDGNPAVRRLNWFSGQPDNSNGIQYYVSVKFGFLYDLGDDQAFQGLCEV